MILTLLLTLLTALSAQAHTFEATDVELTLPGDGTFRVEMTADLDALALGVPWTVDSAELAERLRSLPPEELTRETDRLQETFQRRVRVRLDGEPVDFDVTFPGPDTPEPEIPTVLGTHAILTGTVPETAEALTFFASRAFPPVRLTVTDPHRPDAEPVLALVLERGEISPEIPLDGLPEPPGPWETASRYLWLGFIHIVPAGLDHILFVLGLFLLSARLGPLLWQVTAFTVAHTVTLALSTFGVVSLSPSIVEPLIALSIVYVAVENCLTKELHPWRPAVVFLFGLLHGLGFAGVLGELGLPPGQAVPALASFNVGVELGQLAVIAGAFLVVGAFRNRSWYRSRIVIPASLAIALVGLFWAVERI